MTKLTNTKTKPCKIVLLDTKCSTFTVTIAGQKGENSRQLNLILRRVTFPENDVDIRRGRHLISL